MTNNMVKTNRETNKPFIFNMAAMVNAAKTTLTKPVASHTRTSTGSGNSQVTQAIMACVCQAAVLGSTQLTMSQIKMMLSDGGIDITDKTTAKINSDYVWNLSERKKDRKSPALLTLVKDASGNTLSGVYGINMQHPSVVNAIAKAAEEEVVAE